MPTYQYREYGRYISYGTIEADSYEEAEEMAYSDAIIDDTEFEPNDWEVEEIEELPKARIINQ